MSSSWPILCRVDIFFAFSFSICFISSVFFCFGSEQCGLDSMDLEVLVKERGKINTIEDNYTEPTFQPFSNAIIKCFPLHTKPRFFITINFGHIMFDHKLSSILLFPRNLCIQYNFLCSFTSHYDMSKLMNSQVSISPI